MNTQGHYRTKTRQLCTLMLLMLLILPAFGQEIEGGGIEGYPGSSLTKAEKLYREFSYHEAIPVYLNYIDKHDSAYTAMLQLGDCYRLTSRFDQALYWYGKGLEKGSSTADPKYKLFYAQMLQANEKYTDAAKWYADYKQSVPEDKRANNQLKSSANPEIFKKTANRYEVHNLSFNSPGYDFAPAWDGEGLIYSSSRDSAKAIGRQSTWTGTQFFDMFHVKGEGTGFEKPKPMEGDAATKFHEANATFTPDSTTVYFTRNNYYNGKTEMSADKIIKLDIYSATVDGLKWKDDKEFKYNNDEYSVGHPALSPDGNTMYFVSDMPGGYGATDIYVTKKEGEEWGTPQNLGPEVNTEGYEMFVYVDKDTFLYFASDGHGGLGGLDNFRMKWNNDTKKWGRLRNIGAPINSSYDDFGYVYGKDKSMGYFTSNRPGGKGLDDIYAFEDHGVELEGVVVDARTGKPICESTVKMIVQVNKKEEGPKITECDGWFQFDVIINNDYCFEASAAGYLPNNDVCATTKGVKAGETVYVRIPLQKDEPTAMTVLVIDKATKIPIPAAKVTLSSSCADTVQTGETDSVGTTCHMVKCGCGFIASANAKGYLPGSNEGSNRDTCKQVQCGNPGGDTIIIELEKVNINAVELKDIYYDFDKWNIRSESEVQLNILLGFLKENPDAIVEIASHTDARAPYDYNIRLSQKRAQSVVDWLVSHGVNRSRLKPKGYGETKPRNSCTDDVKCSEYEHQRNRRTEFQVLGGDIDIKSLERFDMQVDPCKVCPF